MQAPLIELETSIREQQFEVFRKWVGQEPCSLLTNETQKEQIFISPILIVGMGTDGFSRSQYRRVNRNSKALSGLDKLIPTNYKDKRHVASGKIHLRDCIVDELVQPPLRNVELYQEWGTLRAWLGYIENGKQTIISTIERAYWRAEEPPFMLSTMPLALLREIEHDPSDHPVYYVIFRPDARYKTLVETDIPDGTRFLFLSWYKSPESMGFIITRENT